MVTPLPAGAQSRPTLVDVTDTRDFWELPDEALDGLSLFEAVEIAWPGWKVAHWHGYVTEKYGAHLAMVMARADGTEGWGATTIRLGGPTVEKSLAAYPRLSVAERFMSVSGVFLPKSVVWPDADFAFFGASLSTRVTGHLGPETADNHLFHRPYLWRAVYDTPATVVPDIETIRFLWALNGVQPPTV